LDLSIILAAYFVSGISDNDFTIIKQVGYF